jgi:hypothetical protein
MKTACKLFFFLVLLIPIGCAGNRVSTVPGTPGAPTALSLLQRRDPRAAWEPASQVHADFDLDGVADYALRGVRKDRVVVGIVQGPLDGKSRTWVLDFPWGKGTQDSLCSKKAKIEAEDLDSSATAGAKAVHGKPAGGRSAQGKGISLYDDQCDSFHIYWNPEDRKFEWWRL